MNARWLVSLLVLLAAASPTVAQADRFEGWDRIVETGYAFDPDVRQILGFSVRTSTPARALMREVEQAFLGGDAIVAGKLLLEMQREYPTHVLQVAGGGHSAPRWVGAGEWAAYQLSHRIPAGTRAVLATPEQKQVLAQAMSWRDEALLERLSIELEGLPEGAEASRSLAQLMRESGRELDASGVDREPFRLDAPVSSGELPVLLDMLWTHGLPIGRLTAESPGSVNPFARYPRSVEASFAPVRPVIADGVAYVTDSLSVRAIDLISGREHWAAAGPLEVHHDAGGRGRSFPFSVYAGPKRSRAINPYQVAQPVLSEEAVFATVQVSEDTYPLDSFDGLPINHPLPRRRLRAYDRVSGALLWRQEREEFSDEAFENRFDPVGPPVLVGERLWVSGAVREGALSAWIVSFDRRTGRLLSRTLLCTGQQELTMFNRPFHEHLVSPPRVQDGSVYVSTNLGVVASVDALTGRTRWITAYEVIEREAAVRMHAVLRDVHWLNEAPWIMGERLVVAPLDSEYLLVLDAATGRYHDRVATQSNRGRTFRHQVVPIDDARALILTRTGIECRDIESGSLIWPHRTLLEEEDVVGRAVLHEGSLIVPCESSLIVVDVETGQVTREIEWPYFEGSHDLQVVQAAQGVLVVTDGAGVHGMLEAEPLERELAVRHAAGDLEAGRRLAELDLLGGRFGEALGGFAKLAAAGPDRALRARIESGRLEAALRRARAEERATDWLAALEAARGSGVLVQHAEEILGALAEAGATSQVVSALDALALERPELRLALGGDEAQPVAVLRARYGLSLLAPPEQLELLQELIVSDPPAEWGGVSVAERARRLQAELLETHGRSLYATLEHEARAAFDAGRSLRDVRRLYPHSLAVVEATRGELRAALDAGRPLEVMGRTLGLADAGLLALRREAAERLGDRNHAALIAGQVDALPTPLPRVPTRDADARQFDLHPLNRVAFRTLTGAPSPELAGYAPGFVTNSGELFAIDTRGGRVAWSGRALPDGRISLVADASFHREGELLVVRGGSTIEAMTLADGAPRWSVDLGGFGAKVVRSHAGGGLFLALRELSGDRMELVAIGLVSGTEAFRIPLEGVTDASMRRAGTTLVLNVLGSLTSSEGSRERRLLVVDLRNGAVLHEESLDDDLIMVGSTHDPERVLFADSRGPTSRLLALQPREARWLWTADSDASFIGSSSLLANGTGGYVLAVPTSQPGTRLRPHRITPVDLDSGPGATAELPLLELVLGHDSGPAPQLVMRDPDLSERFLLVDPVRGVPLDELSFLPGELEGGVRVRHGSDGFVLMAQTWDVPMKTTMWVIRGSQREARYSVDISDLGRRTRPDMLLVDGALLVAAGNSVRVVRSESEEE